MNKRKLSAESYKPEFALRDFPSSLHIRIFKKRKLSHFLTKNCIFSLPTLTRLLNLSILFVLTHIDFYFSYLILTLDEKAVILGRV